jgi:small subunit ribosomal protein S6
MNNYELTLILNPDLSSKFDDFESKFSTVLSDSGFEIKRMENIGRRQLAYSILNHNKGHYVIYQLEGPAEGALELETKLKYDTSVIRHLMLKVDALSLEDSLLMIESREAKKAPEEIKVTPPKTNIKKETESKDDAAEETVTTETE